VVARSGSGIAVGGVSPPHNSLPLEEAGVVVYPNPAQNTLHFTLQNPLTPPAGWSVSLFTPAGQRVLHNTVSPASATASIQVGHLPVGIYFYTVQSGGVVLARGKVAVVR
ncbi:MAG TPA: T9SS type A sorting domain-containing protein, partial [Chitinophagales bacterium]|nr:T9SS type A sorting domain-containing protein [Chitinophagales bacterium]